MRYVIRPKVDPKPQTLRQRIELLFHQNRNYGLANEGITIGEKDEEVFVNADEQDKKTLEEYLHSDLIEEDDNEKSK